MPRFSTREQDACGIGRRAPCADCITGSRALRIAAWLPDAEPTVEAGRHEFATIEIDLGSDRAQIREHVKAERTLHKGPLSARFEQGKVRLSVNDSEITEFLQGLTLLDE